MTNCPMCRQDDRPGRRISGSIPGAPSDNVPPSRPLVSPSQPSPGACAMNECLRVVASQTTRTATGGSGGRDTVTDRIICRREVQMVSLTVGGCGQDSSIPVLLFGGGLRSPPSWPTPGSPAGWPATLEVSIQCSEGVISQGLRRILGKG